MGAKWWNMWADLLSALTRLRVNGPLRDQYSLFDALKREKFLCAHTILVGLEGGSQLSIFH